MDLVSKRYSDPFSFLDFCIVSNNFIEVIDFIFDKEQEQTMWEFYLHTLPYNDKNFEEWKNEVQSKNKMQNLDIDMTKEEIDKVIKNSENILSNFKPPRKGGIKNGAI